MAEPWLIETAGLRKGYAGVEALRGLDLQVPPGSICGLLGRNGAGKTTALKILVGMTHATAGTARVFGLDATSASASVEIRRRTGFVSEEKELYGSMSVRDMIRFTAAFFPKWRAELQERYLRSFDLPPNRQVKALSRGMRAKLALLLALCRGAELLILDEPTSGLDPAAAEEVLQALVTHAADEETTILFSSHQIVEVDQIADRVAIVDGGRAAVAGPLDELRESFCRVRLVFASDAPDAAFRAGAVVSVEREGRVLTVLSRGGPDAVVAEARGLGPIAVDVLPVSLKEIFLASARGEG